MTYSSLAAFGKSSDTVSTISGTKEAWRSSVGNNWDGKGFFTYWHTLKVVSSQEDLCAIPQIQLWLRRALILHFWIHTERCTSHMMGAVSSAWDPCRSECEHTAVAAFPGHSHGRSGTKLVLLCAQADLVPVQVFTEMTGQTGRCFKAGRRNTLPASSSPAALCC